MSKQNNGWHSVKRLPRQTSESNPVDIWMRVTPSPLSMGIGDAWRIVDCWLNGGKWFHVHEGKVKELNADYITHWIRPPKPPKITRV